MQTARTTIELDKDLLKKAKQRALEEDKSLKELITEGLKIRIEEREPKKRKVKFKAYKLGVKGSLRREEIYDWL
jgi:hypothetical protein